MRFGVFFATQIPKPWDAESELRSLRQGLDQLELADQLGFDHAWAIEHHFLEEYSHSGSPEMFLAAASQRSSRIRLGHGIVQMPPGINHPTRVAERISVLDLLSGGRAEYGSGEGTGEVELGGFGVDPATKREQWHEATSLAVRLMTETPFPGSEGQFISIPERNVVPKPLQKPHPPLWMAAPRLESALVAAENGMGSLCFSLNVEPDDAAHIVSEYRAKIASAACVPLGLAVNPEVAMVLPMLCHAEEAVAIDRGLEGAQFYGWSLYYFLLRGAEHPHGASRLWETFLEERTAGFDPALVTVPGSGLRASFDKQTPFGIRGAIGSIEQVRELVRRYEQAGCDQLIFLCQPGHTSHEHTCESLRLFATEIMPEFSTRDAGARAKKQALLEPAIQAALARRASVPAGA
jgi:alkanesulfonate monooxygenase SsuD/methylene tetrahydromethanopterin reductase-like flavin-dependent oxidoreductase (luciferase family)